MEERKKPKYFAEGSSEGHCCAESPNLDSHWPKRLGRVSEAGTLNLTLSHSTPASSAPSPTCVRRPPAARCPRWR